MQQTAYRDTALKFHIITDKNTDYK